MIHQSSAPTLSGTNSCERESREYVPSFFFKSFACAGSSLLTAAFPSCSEWGLLFSCYAQASCYSCFSSCRTWTSEHVGFRSCGARAQLPHSIWNPPGTGIRPVFPAFAGGFPTTGPAGKSKNLCFLWAIHLPSPKDDGEHRGRPTHQGKARNIQTRIGPLRAPHTQEENG